MGIFDLSQLDCLLQPLPISNVMSANLITVLVLDVIPAATTFLINGIFVLTLMKSRELHTPSNVFLMMLGIGDMILGIVVQPIFITMLIYMLIGKDYRTPNYALYQGCALGGGLSFLFAIFISVDRFLAICHPFEYERLVTCKKCAWIAGVASVLLAIYSLFILISWKHLMASFLVIAMIALLTILVSYANIFLVIRKQRRTVFALKLSINKSEVKDLRKTKKKKRKVYTIYLILACFICCYGPLLIWLAYYVLCHWNTCAMSETEFLIGTWREYLVFLNSLLNPIIYFFRSAEMRKIAWKIIKPSQF